MTLQQGHKPLRALRRCGKTVQQFHVAGIGRAAVEHLTGPGNAAHDFCQRRIVKVAQAGTRLSICQVRQKQVPKAFLARKAFEVLQKRGWVQAVVHGTVPGRVVRQNITLHERLQLLAQCQRPGRMCEVHGPIVAITASHV